MRERGGCSPRLGRINVLSTTARSGAPVFGWSIAIFGVRPTLVIPPP
jgi:hypothetical protein